MKMGESQNNQNLIGFWAELGIKHQTLPMKSPKSQLFKKKPEAFIDKMLNL